MIRYAEEEEAYFIIDCNSTNHVYVNGNRVTGQQIARLADKDRIHLATEEFVFHLQK
jgi:pSer/pThr/pTyr-binding forkhead associated (FHA) protein